jgi:PBP1b-binding outer membrane lipoprotein LpoB
MLNKSMLIKLLVFAMILVGCANSDIATEKNESSEVQEEKVAENDSSTVIESSENTGMTANQNEHIEPQQETAYV